jgi:hypothetical protein
MVFSNRDTTGRRLAALQSVMWDEHLNSHLRLVSSLRTIAKLKSLQLHVINGSGAASSHCDSSRPTSCALSAAPSSIDISRASTTDDCES